MTTAIRNGQVLDDFARPVPGASIYVYNVDGTSASLTSDGITPLSQPLLTDSFGNYSYYVLVGYYREDTWYSGKLRFRENNIALGNPGADLALRTDLAATGGAALVNFKGSTAASDVQWGGLRGLVSVRIDQPTNAPNAGWSALKVGICSPTDVGWTNNPSLPGSVALYSYISAENGRTAIWGANPIVTIPSGTDATAWGCEVNVNNAGTVVTDPSATLKKVGVDVVSGGPNHSTAGYRVSSGLTNSTGGWIIGYYAERCANYGFQCAVPAGDTGTQFSVAAYADKSNADVSFKVEGGTHTYGMDLKAGTYTAASVRLPNNQSIAARNAADSADISVIGTNSSNFVTVGSSNAAGVVLGPNLLLVASSGYGYSTGQGGTVTQATSKSTAVTLNKTCGAITMNAAALSATTIVSFTLTNSTIAADDDVRVWVKSGNASAGSYRVASEGNAVGSRTIVVENKTAGSLSEAIVLGFNILKVSVA